MNVLYLKIIKNVGAFLLRFRRQPLAPNKVLEKRWADRTIELHYQRMANIRPNLDSTLTTMQEVQNRSIQHYSKSKKDQLLEGKLILPYRPLHRDRKRKPHSARKNGNHHAEA